MSQRPVMVSNFDALAQARRWVELGGHSEGGWVWRRPEDSLAVLRRRPELREDFVGTLRTAHLFADRIVLTDAQLLDGIFFQALGPKRIGTLLGRSDLEPAVLEVRCRRETLAESLRSFVCDDGSGSGGLAAVKYSTVTATGRAVDFDSLRRHPSAAVRQASLNELAHVCASEIETGLALEPGMLAALAGSWAAWLAAAESGVIEATHVEIPPEQHFQSVAASWPPPSAEGDEDLVERLQRTAKRSAALSMIEASSIQNPDQMADWYDRVYQDALATHHGADWLDLQSDARTAAGPVRAKGRGAVRVALAGQVTTTLGEMSIGDFAALTTRHRETLAEWRQERDARTSAKVAFAVDQQRHFEDFDRARRRTVSGALTTLSLALLLFLLDALSLVRSSWAFWLFAAALLATLLLAGAPFVRRFVELRRYRTGAASIYLTRRSSDE